MGNEPDWETKTNNESFNNNAGRRRTDVFPMGVCRNIYPLNPGQGQRIIRGARNLA
jgi:hypothetical protein